MDDKIVIPPHIEILETLQRAYYCKICHELLIQAKVLDCGHIFCTYCLDLLPSLSCSCPTCSTRIKTAIPLPQIDSKIDSLIRLLPPALQSGRATSKSIREEKASDRASILSELSSQLGPKPIRTGSDTHLAPFQFLSSLNNVDDFCSRVLDKKSPKNLRPVDTRARSRPRSRQGPNLTTSRTRLLPTPPSCQGVPLDLEGAEDALLSIYDEFLTHAFDLDLEGGGDAGSVQDLQITSPDKGGLKDKDRLEIEQLLQEAEGCLELDAFVKDWSSQFGVKLEGEESAQGMGWVLEDDLVTQIRALQGRSVSVLAAGLLSLEQKPRDPKLLSLQWRQPDFQEVSDKMSPGSPTEYDAALQKLRSHLELNATPRDKPRYPQTARGERRHSDLDLEPVGLRPCRTARGRNPEVLFHTRRTSDASSNFVQNTATFCKKLDDCKNALVILKNTNVAHSAPDGIRELLPKKECKTARLPHDFRQDSYATSQNKLRLNPRLSQIDLETRPKSDLIGVSTSRTRCQNSVILPRIEGSSPYPSSNLRGSQTARNMMRDKRKELESSRPISRPAPKTFSARGGF